MSSNLEFPSRIVCLTEETTETLYLLNEDWRIVGISGFTVRPPHARKEKPIVSAFTKARIGEIVALKPDLVLGFSDIQADIASQLVAEGLEVYIFNHRSIAGILRMVRTLGALVGAESKARALANQLSVGLEEISNSSLDTRRPLVYFEEWNEPLISGIGWVSELISIAGGIDIFADRAQKSLAKQRIISNALEVIERRPDIIIGSWCGKPFRSEQVISRAGWHSIPAVKNGDLHEIHSSLILQPGPAALTEGVRQLRRIIAGWQVKHTT